MSESVREQDLDIVLLLLRSWRKLAILVAAGLIGGVAYGLLAPKWYSATLTVVPSQRSNDVAMASIAAALPSGLESFSTDVQRIQAVFNSASVADEVIEKFKLDEHYGTTHREHTRDTLRKHCSTSVDRRSSVVTLTCEDSEPKRAMAMAAFYGEVGNKVFGRVSSSSAREERKFLESQVEKTRRDVEQASQKLREFQEKHRIIDLGEQSKALISAMASIQGDLISKQLELSYLSSFSASTEPSVVQLQKQIGIMEGKLKQLEAARKPSDPAAASDALGAGSGSAKNEFFPSAMSVPELRFELEQLMRDQKIQETVFFLTTQRYEMAKINEARDTSTFQILDYPTEPTYRSRPSPKKLGILGAAAGLALTFAIVLIPAWWERRRLGEPAART